MGTPRNTGTAEKPRKTEFDGGFFCFIREHVKNKMSMLFVYPRTLYNEL